MNDPLETLLELREFLAHRAQYRPNANGRLVANRQQELLVKLDELIDIFEADRELEKLEAAFDERVAQLRRDAKARNLMDE